MDQLTLPRGGHESRPAPRFGLGGRQLIGLGILLLCLSVASIVGMLWHLRGEAVGQARVQVGNLGVAIAEQTSRSMQSADLVLATLQREIAGSGLDSVGAFKAALGTESMGRSLRLRSEGLPQVDAFTIIAADGKLVNYSRPWPVPATDLSDRDYYAYFRDGGAASTFVSAPVRNRGNGKWTFYIVRRIDGRSGGFLGMVLVALEVSYFEDFYKALNAGAEMRIVLSRRDGVVLTQYPPPAEAPGMLPAAEPSLITYSQALVDYPLVVEISTPERVALAGWWRVSLVAGASTVFAAVCVGLLLRALLGQFERQARSETSLAERNAVLEDVRQRLGAQALELSASEARLAGQSSALQGALAHMNQGIIMVAADHRVAVWNQRALEMLDLPEELVASRPTFEALAAYQRSMGEFLASDNFAVFRLGYGDVVTAAQKYERRRPNGMVLEVQTIPMADGGMVRTYTDITERRAAEEQVRYFAHHDSLTQLGNRTVFTARLENAIELADRGGQSVAVLYLDLDRFKSVNDTYGHTVGDKLLVEVAARLQAVARKVDTVARMGGDEFAVIQVMVSGPAATESLASRILEAVGAPYEFDGTRCTVSASIGIAVYPRDAPDAEQLLRDADIALYRAKESGKNTFRVFDETMDRRQQHIFTMEQDLRHALSDGQFVLEYQPIFETESLRLVRLEALLRWMHPEQGVIGPADFIGMAEKSGLIVPIGAWVLESACAEAMTWAGDVDLAINLSPVQFTRGDLAAMVLGVLRSTGFPAARLHLEVTEGVILDETTAVLEAMATLRAAGVRFSLDDFGIAHAGLSYLRHFQFDGIKIDKSFIHDATGPAKARAIVTAILAIGTAFGLTTTAEGLETPEQLAVLRQLGCDQVQGYLLGRPMTPVGLLAWWEAGGAGSCSL